jgi:hypothetical protein
MSRSDEQQEKSRAAGGAGAAVAQMTYEMTDRFPAAEPTVKLVFHGLLNFFFDGKRGCEIGIPNITQGLPQPHPHPHEFNISVWTTALGGVCLPSPLLNFQIKNTKDIGGVKIDVHNPDEFDGVYVYGNPKGSFVRPNPQNDPRDWRWVVDFERDVYSDRIKPKASTLTPSVQINNGLFYTLFKTTTNFALRPDEDSRGDRLIGNIAEYVAANIYAGQVDLTILPLSPDLPHLPIPLVAGLGLRYQIDITNSCRQGADPCHFDPAGDKHHRNDFYLYYETFEKPASNPVEYGLVCMDCQGQRDQRNEDELGICLEQERKKRHITSNNEAPCGPSGYGQTPGSGG